MDVVLIIIKVILRASDSVTVNIKEMRSVIDDCYYKYITINHWSLPLSFWVVTNMFKEHKGQELN